MPARSATSSATKPLDEKITINLGYVDLGQIDLLVQEGFYANRTDLIRTAIRNQLAVHADVVKQSAARKTLVLGIQHFGADELRSVQAAGQRLQIRVLGLAAIAPDVTPELALATIESVVVLGALHAPPAVKAALASRIR
ncbi:CopG family transcriptional regulator [Piscinibacter sp. XHJ-5]|uniref:CopG family transcriptional regulator n=1 Tax=Piscinibacter sp. XHJ-5 TaxID=3037797 RepID=UPI002452FD28|nr:CopG family transcriptional regulator [Piscinibacter sp. XHJ-5]